MYFDMESVRVALATASAGPVAPARDGRGRVAREKPAAFRLSPFCIAPHAPGHQGVARNSETRARITGMVSGTYDVAM